MNLAWKPTIPSHLGISRPTPKKPHKMVTKSNGCVDWDNKNNINALAELMRQGLTHAQAAKKLKLTVNSVIWGCKRNNLKAISRGRRPNRVFSRQQWDLIIELRAIGVNYNKIGEYVGATKSVIANQVHNNESVQKIIEQKRNDFVAQVITQNARKYQDESSI